MTHTKEPWIVVEKPTSIGRCYRVHPEDDKYDKHGGACLYDDDTSLNPHADGEQHANAARIVAAVNACAGVTLGEGADVKLLVKRATEAKEAIESLEPDALGHGDPTPTQQGWFIRDELISYLLTALAPFVADG